MMIRTYTYRFTLIETAYEHGEQDVMPLVILPPHLARVDRARCDNQSMRR